MENFMTAFPIAALVISTLVPFMIRRWITNADKAKEKEKIEQDKTVAEINLEIEALKKQCTQLLIELERRVTYDHLDKAIKEVRDDIKDMFTGLKDDLKLWIRKGN